jgi:Leucine-rich repeat (LRR) protein
MLYLDDNLLFGNIPESLGMCIRLNMLNLSVNNLDGFIPSEILSISSLSLGLDLSNNNLAGTMPLQIGSLINLDLLNVSNNMLSGEISPTLGLCAVLSSLQMESNMLSGIIPENFQKLGAIHQIDLSKTYMGQFQNSSITSRPYIILTYPTTNWKDQFQLLVFSQIQMQLHWMVTRRYVNILPYLHCHSAPLHQ